MADGVAREVCGRASVRPGSADAGPRSCAAARGVFGRASAVGCRLARRGQIAAAALLALAAFEPSGALVAAAPGWPVGPSPRWVLELAAAPGPTTPGRWAGPPPPSALASAAQEDGFRQGNAFYEAGDFEAAAAAYSSVLATGMESAALHYNLGNAHYRLGRLGPAVLAYERAARLDPGGDDVRANLALVNARLRDRFEPLPRFWLSAAVQWWLAVWPRHVAGLAAACAYLALGAVLAMLVLGRPRGAGRALRAAAWTAGTAAVLLGFTLAAKEAGWAHPEEAVVMAGEAQAVSAPSADGLALFTIHEGTKVRVDRRDGDWAEIVLADGRVGWLDAQFLEAI